jgi:hypothetical protein
MGGQLGRRQGEAGVSPANSQSRRGCPLLNASSEDPASLGRQVRHHLLDAASEMVLNGPPVDLGKGRIYVEEPELGVQNGNADRRTLEELTQPVAHLSAAQSIRHSCWPC